MTGIATAERIWITGMGLVTALGVSVPETWHRLVRGDRGLAPLRLFDGSGQRATTVAAAPDVPPPDTGKKWSRTSAFAWHAARQAMAEARLDTSQARVGLVVGGTVGGMFETEAHLARLHVDPNHIDSLVDMITHPLTATGDRLVEHLGPFCRVRSLCSACSSGANALVVGARWLLSGDVDAVVAGGSDGLCRLTLTGFNALGATDPDPCRPFDAQRKGLNLGEGAGFAVLERASTAMHRGVAPVAELAGWAVGAEAHHITNPEPTGAAAAEVITRCLAHAGLSPRDVDYVNAHGTGTQLNDPMEVAALRRACGNEIERIPVSSSKGQLGHMLGAAGAVEAILSALTVSRQAVLPTMGLEEPDPDCRLVHILHEGRTARVRATLSSSFGFGGMDCVLLVTEPELGPPRTTGGPFRRVVITGAATLTREGLDDGDSAARFVDGSTKESPPTKAGPLDIDLAALLDLPRARRLDRPARLAAVVAERALAEAEYGALRLTRSSIGIVLGTAFGSLDASAAFMHRLFEKGPRFASPLDFPNLVPSSPVGHVSIYLGLRRFALTIADLSTSGESAVVHAVELVAGGEGDVVVAGAVEEASQLVERVLASLDPTAQGGVRSEGAAMLVIEALEHAQARGKTPLACIDRVESWTSPGVRLRLPPPADPPRARVVSCVPPAELMALLAGTGWSEVAQTSVSPGVGKYEGLGAVALAAAASMVHRGLAKEVLLIGLTQGRGYSIMLAAP